MDDKPKDVLKQIMDSTREVLDNHYVGEEGHTVTVNLPQPIEFIDATIYLPTSPDVEHWKNDTLAVMSKSDDPEGKKAFVARLGDSVNVTIFAITDQSEVVLTKKYYRSVNNYVWSLPHGFAKLGEDLEAAARRIFREITGLKTHKDFSPRTPEMCLNPDTTNERNSIVMLQVKPGQENNLMPENEWELHFVQLDIIGQFFEPLLEQSELIDINVNLGMAAMSELSSQIAKMGRV